MVMQDPKYSLNPVMTIGEQIIEAYRAHASVSRAEARDKALRHAGGREDARPGARLHAVSARSLGRHGPAGDDRHDARHRSDLLIADEPTSALDVTVQIEVLRILDELVAERGMGLIFICHDLKLVSSFCDRVLVMYAARFVEEVEARALKDAKHRYTQGLMRCLPSLGDAVHPLPILNRDPAWAQ